MAYETGRNETVPAVELTPYQKIFYYEWLLDPKRYDYNVLDEKVIEGDLSVDRLNSVFVRFSNDYLLWRSTVAEDGDKLYWKERDPLPDNAQAMRYFDKPIDDAEIFSILSQPFDLKNDLLFRAFLVKLSDRQYRFFHCYHHTVMDGAKVKPLYSEISNYYNDPDYTCAIDLNKQKSLVGGLASSMQTFINENRNGMESFWREYSRESEPVDLAFLKGSMNNQADIDPLSPVSLCHFSFGRNNLDNARLLSRKYRATLYIYAQVILAMLFHLMTGQRRVSFSYPVTIPEGDALIYGSQVNTLFINFSFDEGTTVAGLIEQAKGHFHDLKSFKAKYMPISDIHRFLDGKNVLQVAFANTSRELYFNLNGTTKEINNERFYFDMSSMLLILMEEKKDALHFWFKYKNRILDGKLVDNLAVRYQRLFCDVTNSLIKEM